LGEHAQHNRYFGYLSQSLRERCEALQSEAAHSSWASMRQELELARVTLVDSVQFYNGCHQLPIDTPARLEVILKAGEMLRDATDSIADLALKAAKVEAELKDKHDPQITLNLIQQTVKVIDMKLREAELTGQLVDAEKWIQEIAAGVDMETRLPADTPFGFNKTPASVSPSTANDMVIDMIASVPPCQAASA
jgi:hypothetical protein